MNRLLIYICLFLSGCTVGPKYIKPEIDVPCGWQSEDAVEVETDPIDNYCWWQSLNDPVLNSLIELAAAQNLDLQMAMSRIWEARLNLKGVEASWLPHIDGSASYSYATFNQKTLNHILGFGSWGRNRQRNLNIFEAGFDAEWEIDLFGMNAHQDKAFSAMADAADEDFSNAWVTLSAEIAKGYVELRGFQRRLDILNANIEAQRDVKELTNSLITGGFVGSVDQMQAEEELNELISQKPQLEFLIKKSIHHLSILLGSFPAELWCKLSPSEPLPCLPCYRPIGIPSELLKRRPDIRKAERDLEAATEHVGVAVAALFPRISLTGFIGDISTFCTNGSLTALAGPQLLLPVFNSRILKQDVCANKLKAQQAALQYQKTILEAFEETENAIAAFHHEMEKNRYLEQVRNSSQNVYETTLQLYQSGLKNYLEVQASHRLFLAAENVFLQSQVDLLVNYIALYKALGGGWNMFLCDQ